MPKDAPYIGQMDRKIIVYRTEVVVNEVSEHKETLVEVARPWAFMNENAGGQEVDGKVTSEVQRSYTIYRNPEIAANGWKMTLEDSVLRYEITRVKEIGRTHLELTVRLYE